MDQFLDVVEYVMTRFSRSSRRCKLLYQLASHHVIFMLLLVRLNSKSVVHLMLTIAS